MKKKRSIEQNNDVQVLFLEQWIPAFAGMTGC
jgi:hypothetical protein